MVQKSAHVADIYLTRCYTLAVVLYRIAKYSSEQIHKVAIYTMVAHLLLGEVVIRL